MTLSRLALAIFLLGCLARHNVLAQTAALPPDTSPLIADSARREVRIGAIYQPERFSGFLRATPNYHLLVWQGGGAAGAALFRTVVPDTVLIAALERLGAVAGNNLTMEAWSKRHEANHPAPQTRMAGTRVDILVGWEGLPEPLPLAVLLDDPGKQGLDFRFGGNRSLIHHWHSGCLVCLYSCPGAKIGNAAYTVRDYAVHKTKFTPKKERLPKSGSPVVLHFRIIS